MTPGASRELLAQVTDLGPQFGLKFMSPGTASVFSSPPALALRGGMCVAVCGWSPGRALEMELDWPCLLTKAPVPPCFPTCQSQAPSPQHGCRTGMYRGSL